MDSPWSGINVYHHRNPRVKGKVKGLSSESDENTLYIPIERNTESIDFVQPTYFFQDEIEASDSRLESLDSEVLSCQVPQSKRGVQTMISFPLHRPKGKNWLQEKNMQSDK